MISVVKNICLIFGIAFLFFACKAKNKEYVRIGGNAQGTTFAITYEPQTANSYEGEIDSLFKAIDHSMSLWDTTSLIVKFNESNKPIIVDTFFQDVLKASFIINKATSGAFDPTVGPLVKVWGFARKHNKKIPTDGQIDSLRPFIGLQNILLKDNLLIKEMAQCELDFNAIAQGYTVDVIADFLERKGVINYLVEVGGELRSKGKNQKGENWQIGIEKPDFNESSSGNSIEEIVAISGKSLATSGNYRKFIEIDGQKFSHTIDPLTGRPVIHNTLSVSVIADKCMDADAYATAFMVMGKDKALNFAAEHGMEIQCVTSENDELKIYRSAGFEKYLVKGN